MGAAETAVPQSALLQRYLTESGGRWGEEVVLNGRVATVSGSDFAQELMKSFSRSFKKRFSKIKAFYVGLGASVLLDAGKRLTAAEQSHREFDLTREMSALLRGVGALEGSGASVAVA